MQPRKILTISLLIDEVINDVELNTTKTADTIATEGSAGTVAEARAKMQIGGTEGDEVIAMRLIGDSASQLRSKIPDYMLAVNQTTTDALTSGKKNIILEFSLPYRWNEATMDSLVTAVHRYVVSKSIERWHTMTNRTDYAASYKDEALAALDDIRIAVSSRKRPTRPTLYDVETGKVTTWYVYRGAKRSGDESNLLHAEPRKTYPTVEADGKFQYDTAGNMYTRTGASPYDTRLFLACENGQEYTFIGLTSTTLADGRRYTNNNGLIKLIQDAQS